MFIRERIVADVTVFDLAGKMTLGEGDELLKDRTDAMLAAGRKKLVLNMGGVPYIDSAGNGEIVRTYTTVSRNGGKVVFLHMRKRLMDLYATTKLLTVFEIYDDELEALACFSKTRRTSVCPVCRLRAAFASDLHTSQTCANCGSEFSLRSSEARGAVTWTVEMIRHPTYQSEQILLKSSRPWIITIEGRLDLFSAEALEEIWRAVPRPRKLLVELGSACRMVTRKGLAVLATLAEPEIDGGRTAVIFADDAEFDRALLPAHPAFFDDRRAALSSLRIDGPIQPLLVEVT